MSPLIPETKDILPILIIDRQGIFGEALAKKLSHDSAVVLATGKETSPLENVVKIPFNEDIPKIPDNTYSHIFVIDDGRKITLEFLLSFFNKAKDDKSIFCFCTPLDKQESVPEELYEYRKSRIIFFGDLFPIRGLSIKSYINRFINSSKNKGKINVLGEGMTVTYPVFFEDAIFGILEASFGTSSEKNYFIFPKHGVTLLALAHMIQKNDPNIKIDFSKEEPVEVSVPREGKYVLAENYPLEERIKNLKLTVGKFEEKIKEDSDKGNTGMTKKINFINLRIFSFAVILFIFLPLFTTLLFSFMGFLSLDAGLNISNPLFNLADDFSKPLIYETGFFGFNPFSELTKVIEAGKSQTEEISNYRNSFYLFSKGETLQAIASLKNFLIYSQKNKDLKILDPKQLDFISQTINAWPQILATNSKKTYLILVQNDLIPRPTGGEIEVFGFLTFDNGKFSDFKIFTTQNSDKNLKGHVEPPFGLRRFLPTKDLFMKDSNFNPDFGESATSAAFFASLEEGQNTDGVIAIDFYALQKLKELLGENTGSVNNTVSLKSTVLDIFRSLEKKNNAADIFLSNDLIKLVGEKHVLFYFNDPSIQNIFLTNDFSSSLFDDRVSNPKTINDFISFIETDLGSPIKNIDRKLSDSVNISQNGVVSVDLSLKYRNNGDNDYKNYLRFITPFGASLDKIKIDNVDTDFTDAITDPSLYESKDFSPPKKLEVEKYSESGKSFFGFLVTIPKGGTKNIEIIYKFNPISLSGVSDFTYNLKTFKQPGVQPYPFNFLISYPDSFKTSDKTSFSKTLDGDYALSVDFFQK